MSEQSQIPEPGGAPAADAPVAAAPPAPESTPAFPGVASAADRPEVAVGAAFAGGLFLALILKRLAR